MNTNPERPFCRYLGLALTTCSMLLLQLYLTRVFTVLFHSSFAFLAISIAFLGLGSAGVFAYLFSGLFPPSRLPRRVSALGLAYSVVLGIAFWGLVTLDSTLMSGGTSALPSLKMFILRVFLAGAIMVPGFFLAGLILSLVFKHHLAVVNRLYFADLLGAGIGCVLVLPLLSVIGGDNAIFFVCMIAAGGASFLALAAGGSRGLAGAGAGLVVGFAALMAVNPSLGLVKIRSHATSTGGAGTQRSRDKAVKGNAELFSAWNSFSRIGVFETVGGKELYVRIDSSCQTSIPVYTEEVVAEQTAELTFEQLPFLLNRHRRYLEIGAGGGAGMVFAHHFGAERIVGVEINDITVDCAKRIFAERCRMPDLFSKSDVDLVVDEGRSYVTQSDELFDTLTITFIQTGAASGATAFALSEANLFTVEAFTEFLKSLDAGGLFYVYRHGGNQMLRLISIVREAYRALGIEDLRKRVFIAKDPVLNHAVLMASRNPFTAGEIEKLEGGCRNLKLKVLYSPGSWNDGKRPNPLLEALRDLRLSGQDNWKNIGAAYNRQHNDDTVLPIEHAYLTSPNPEAFREDYFLDISATTDDRPYFFFFSVNRIQDFWRTFQPASLEFLGSIVVLLFWLLVLFSGLVLVLIVFPLCLKHRSALKGGGRAAYLTYFAILGVSYISIEVSFIQRFVLFLGHPIYAVSVVLMAFLVFTGVGSFFSDALFRRGVLTIPRTLVVLAVLLVVYDQVLPGVFHSSLISLAVVVKILLSAVLILPLAFLMGILFPQGLRRVEKSDADLVPWVWGANSATSVIGSILSLILAIHFGFSVVLFFVVGLYLVCLVLMRHGAWRGASDHSSTGETR